MGMKRGALHLAGHSEGRLIEALAEGIPMIVEIAESLERVARTLFEAEKYQASEIIRGFAEEEAAKVLILLDALRCPKEQRSATLWCFYQHLPKRIYALTCGFPRVWTFGELGGLVALERQPYYLDGPNKVDWIVANSITTERERAIYVDYVFDTTGEPSGHWWSVPDARDSHPGQYRTPESVELGRALCEAGAKSREGLAVIADAWRGFAPEEDTDPQSLAPADRSHVDATRRGRSLQLPTNPPRAG